MTSPQTAPDRRISWLMLARILVKATLLFTLMNLLFAWLEPLPALGRLSLYNTIVPGRERLPYGERPDSYNLSLNNLNAMFAAHRLAAPKPADEFRVVLLGDSSVWGVLLQPDETLAAALNRQDLRIGEQPMRFYNLGHPVLSATKDLLILEQALAHQPDAILWLVTLESLAPSRQLSAPLVQQNAASVRRLYSQTGITLPEAELPPPPTFAERTLVGQRRALADWFRLQLYGLPWAFTGIDQVMLPYTPRANNFEADTSWTGHPAPTTLAAGDLAFDVLAAGQTLAGEIPLLWVNEPIFIASGTHSDLRYNFWYPRWAYDQYRLLFSAFAAERRGAYLDLWDAIAPGEFTDSPVHLTPAGTHQIAKAIAAHLSAWLADTRRTE